MTCGYERIIKVLNGNIPDRIPVRLRNFMHTANEYGYSMEQFRNSPKIIADCFINTTEKYRLDGILTDMDTTLLAGACGAELDFPENEPARVVGRAGENIEDILKNWMRKRY